MLQFLSAALAIFNIEEFINDFKGTHTLEVNKFFNMTQNYHGFKQFQSVNCPIVLGSFGLPYMGPELDWREENVVTEVKDQGTCGSCWSFSTTGAVEGVIAIQTGKLKSLSQQELISCANEQGCNGGSMTNAFDYVIDKGICSEQDVPYNSASNTFCYNLCEERTYISSCKTIPSGNQKLMMKYIQFQPLSIAIQSNNPVFKFYKSGVITTADCGDDVNHGALIVGYGTENDIDYWLVKNSWGTDWGENGYVKIKRSHSTNDIGICGIASSVSFPLL